MEVKGWIVVVVVVPSPRLNLVDRGRVGLLGEASDADERGSRQGKEHREHERKRKRRAWWMMMMMMMMMMHETGPTRNVLQSEYLRLRLYLAAVLSSPCRFPLRPRDPGPWFVHSFDSSMPVGGAGHAVAHRTSP